MFTIDAFVAPALLWLVKLLHSRAASKKSAWCRTLDMLLPRILKVETSRSAEDENEDPLQPAQYFSFDEFVVRMLNMVAILSTFGVILPPVAVVCCVAVWSATFQTQLLIGHLVTVRPSLVSGIEERCGGAMDMFINSVWIVVPFTTLFYALFLFDTLGDAVGWRAALWAPLLMCSLPLFFRLMYTISQRAGAAYGRRRTKRRVSKSHKYEPLQRFAEDLEGERLDSALIQLS
jgi:hypothetical protein